MSPSQRSALGAVLILLLCQFYLYRRPLIKHPRVSHDIARFYRSTYISLNFESSFGCVESPPLSTAIN
ncbi:hypothetical protein BD779DRAFT_1487265 [Infundibulicybe gibba]|nr:hypothetical protein BD779DRAFT_1487265 [Infundibulicybe gibba]